VYEVYEVCMKCVCSVYMGVSVSVCKCVREYVCVHLIHIHIHIIVKHVSEWTTVHNTCVGVCVGVCVGGVQACV
jgi:hypothetical protein